MIGNQVCSTNLKIKEQFLLEKRFWILCFLANVNFLKNDWVSGFYWIEYLFWVDITNRQLSNSTPSQKIFLPNLFKLVSSYNLHLPVAKKSALLIQSSMTATLQLCLRQWKWKVKWRQKVAQKSIVSIWDLNDTQD